MTYSLDHQEAGTLEIDHSMLEIELTKITQKRGTDLKTIDESIYEDLTFVNKLIDTIEFIIETSKPQTNGTWRKTWERIKKTVRSM